MYNSFANFKSNLTKNCSSTTSIALALSCGHYRQGTVTTNSHVPCENVKTNGQQRNKLWANAILSSLKMGFGGISNIANTSGTKTNNSIGRPDVVTEAACSSNTNINTNMFSFLIPVRFLRNHFSDGDVILTRLSYNLQWAFILYQCYYHIFSGRPPMGYLFNHPTIFFSELLD